MNRLKMALAGGAVAASMFTGGILGAALWSTRAVAATAAPTTAATTHTRSPRSASTPVTLHPNRDDNHAARGGAAAGGRERAG